MTAPHIVDRAALVGEALTDAPPDLMRQLLETLINALLSADADQVVDAEWGQPTPGRSAQHNGCRHRDLEMAWLHGGLHAASVGAAPREACRDDVLMTRDLRCVRGWLPASPDERSGQTIRRARG